MRSRWLVRARSLVLTSLVSLFFWATGTSLIYADDAAPLPYAATLRQHGIAPNAAGMGKYLRQLHPDEQQQREAQRLIEQLGSERFAERESAMKRLLALPMPPTEALRIAAESGDREVRLRAEKILAVLAKNKPQRRELIYAIFKTIERAKVPGLASGLLRAAVVCEQRYLRLALRAAMRATAGPDDASLLRKATKDDDTRVAIAAIGGLGALGKSARDDLRRLLEHKTEEISLAAARALADQGDRTSLGRLVKLLDAAALEVRVDAAAILRQVTHTLHKYAAYEDASTRKEAIGRWTAWVEGEGRTAKLYFPLKRGRVELGRTLIALNNQHKVIELDASGKQVWEKTGLKWPAGCRGLTNGHRLIWGKSGGGYVVEYDASGEEVWRKDGLPAFNVRRLENGNTLIACTTIHKVVEIRPDGSTAWEITIKRVPADVQRLDNGRTLVTLYLSGLVVEVDRAGKEHRELKDLDRPISAQRLKNGNTLVAEHFGGRVAEWDLGGKIVWQYTDLQYVRSAQRLSNGNTLIAYGNEVREVDRQGRIVWQKKITGVANATRY